MVLQQRRRWPIRAALMHYQNIPYHTIAMSVAAAVSIVLPVKCWRHRLCPGNCESARKAREKKKQLATDYGTVAGYYKLAVLLRDDVHDLFIMTMQLRQFIICLKAFYFHSRHCSVQNRNSVWNRVKAASF